MRLLVILPGAIGDFILTLPSIAWVKRKLRPSFFEIWTERATVPLAVSSGYADKALALADTGLDCWPTPETVINRLKQFDRVLSWRGAGHGEWRQEMCRRLPAIDFLSGFPSSLQLHAMDFRRQQVESLLGADRSFPASPSITLSPHDIEFAQDFLAGELEQRLPVVMVHPGASGERKRWPADQFSQLVCHLIGSSHRVLLCEGPLDTETANEVLANLPDKTDGRLRRVRIDNLLRLAAVIRHCCIYIGNDSGVGHLSAATGSPTLSIFTATDPGIWAPKGPRARFLVSPSVSAVLQECSAMKQWA